MKVLILFQPNKKQDGFEGSRLRKTIKGALKLAGVSCTSSLDDDYDIVHLISYDDYAKVVAANEKNVPIIASVLMCESDAGASFLDFKDDDGKITYTISNKALKFLNKINRVIIPSKSAEDLLKANGVDNKFSVVLPGVNFSRFDFSRDDEKELFYRYFKEEKNHKLVVGNGDYGSIEGINAFILAANKCPDAIFYFFGQASSDTIANKQIKSLIKKAPKNCHFKEICPDDIYRSALINADVFMLPCYRYAGVISILEAMAAKCELVVRKQAVFDGILQDGVNAHIASFSETLAALTKDCLEGKSKSTIFEAYEEVKKYSVENIGEQLKSIYQQELTNINGGQTQDD